MTATTKRKFAIGDRVRYSSKFCRTVGAVSGFTPQARGAITGFTGDLAHISWDFPGPDGLFTGYANVFNLQKLR